MPSDARLVRELCQAAALRCYRAGDRRRQNTATRCCQSRPTGNVHRTDRRRGHAGL